MSKNIVVGIDVGTNTTRVMVCEYMAGSSTPRVIGVGVAPTAGVRHGYIINRYEAAKSIRQAAFDAEKSSGIKIKQAFVAIGGISLASRLVKSSVTIESKTGEVTVDDIAYALDTSEASLVDQDKNVKVIHRFPLKYTLDTKAVLGQPLGLRGKKLEVTALFVTCLEHHFEDLYAAVTDAGIQVVDVVAAPIATSMATLTSKQKMAGCVLVDIGAETVSAAVFENNTLMSLQIFSIGSSDITNDIALGFKIPLDEAEVIKKTPQDEKSRFSKTRIDEIIEARLSDIFELVEKHLKKIKRSALLPAGAVIVGGGSTLATMEGFAKAVLRLPSRVMRIEHISNTRRKLTDPSWFVAYGLCYLGDPAGDYHKGPGMGAIFKNMKENVRSFFKQLLP